jgi:hypothetical protein
MAAPSPPTLTINPVSFSGYYDISLTLNNATNLTVKTISAVTNENTASSPIVETFFPVLTTGENPQPITSIRLDSNVLPLGKKTLVFVRYVFSDNSFVDSDVKLLTNNSVAITPVISSPQVIRPEDGGFSINISSLYTLNSESDGFSPINKVIVIISKVGGTLTTDVVTRVVPIAIESSIPIYNRWYQIGSLDFTNATLYEVSISVVNGVAISRMSNTIIVSPLDTASQMIIPKVYSLLTLQQQNNLTLNDTRGDTVVFFNKPDDYDQLFENNRRVLKYKLYEQEYITDMLNNEVTFGTPTLIELTVPATGLATFEVATPVKSEPNISTTYVYKHIIEGSPARLGKKFKYYITANNINGDGPISNSSSMNWAFIQSSPQEFALNHTNTVSNITATPLYIFNGKMTLSLSSLSSTNGGKQFVNTQSFPAVTTGNNLSNAYTVNSVTYKLNVLTETTNPETKFSGDVTFIQDISSTQVVTGTSPNQVTTTTYAPQSSYTLNFDNVDTDNGTSGIQSLNSKLVNGTKYRFSLSRKSCDPASIASVFYSNSTDTLRTKFESPTQINNIQSYGINDDLSPVSSSTEPKLRLVFKQLTPIQLNGMAVFNADIQYRAFQGSLPIESLAPIVHDNNITSNREFTISQASFGNPSSNYIRVKAFNPELNMYIDAQESSPAVIESAFTYPPAVSGLTISKTSSTSILIKYVKQGNNNYGGSPSGNIQNRVVVFKDNTSDSVFSNFTLLNDWNNTTSNVTVPSLSAGETYTVFVIAERVYTKDDITGPARRFDNVLIRNNYIKQTVVMSETPGVPANIELFPSSGKITVYYDQPQLTTLQGISLTTLRYHFFCNQDAISFPVDTTVTPNVVQSSVLDVSGSAEAVITQAFRTKAAAANRTGLQPLLNDTQYNFAMRVVGTIGGHTLTKTTYSSTYGEGKFQGSTMSNIINLVADAVVPSEEVSGIMSSTIQVAPGDGVPLPTGVSVLPQDSKLVVMVKKDVSGQVNNMIVTLSKNDAQDNAPTPNPIDAFDTRSLATAQNPSGLFNLETSWQSGSGSIPLAFQKYNFSREIISSETYYKLEFTNLVNGIIYDVEVRNSKTNIGDGSFIFSESVLVSRAAEAPPTVVRTPSFSVNANLITANWIAPLNFGGANIGGNGPLKYKVRLLSSAGNILQVFETSSLTYTIPNLLNGTDYKVDVAGFYVKASDNSDVIGPFLFVNSATGNLIRPNVAPVGGTITSVVNENNKITIQTLTAASAEQTLNPLTKLQVWVRDKATPLNQVCVAEISGLFTGLNTHTTVITAFTAVSGAPLSTIVHQKPLNGYTYEVVLRHIASYTYAQTPPDKVIDAIPMGALNIISAAIKSGTNNKTYTLNVNLNGSGSINNIVALAKGAGSNAILVSNLSSGTLPIISISGLLDNSSAFVAANQTAAFDLPFPAASGNVTDLLAVVVSQNSSDTIVMPDINGFFN